MTICFHSALLVQINKVAIHNNKNSFNALTTESPVASPTLSLTLCCASFLFKCWGSLWWTAITFLSCSPSLSITVMATGIMFSACPSGCLSALTSYILIMTKFHSDSEQSAAIKFQRFFFSLPKVKSHIETLLHNAACHHSVLSGKTVSTFHLLVRAKLVTLMWLSLFHTHTHTCNKHPHTIAMAKTQCM